VTTDYSVFVEACGHCDCGVTITMLGKYYYECATWIG